MLRIICPNEPDDKQYLAEMHQLRFTKFVKELKWSNGLYVFNQMEHDDFDHDHAFYLIHTDGQDKVDALVRLTQTLYPNVLMDIFQENIEFIKPERSESVVEISRFCADQERAPKDIMCQIIAGLLQLGLEYNIQYYVSFSNTHIKPRTKLCGWPAQEIGRPVKVGKEYAVALKHDVSVENYENVCQRMKLREALLSNKELEKCPLRPSLPPMTLSLVRSAII
jgi:N-acyl-L-homoserine lactone synthetase